MQQRGFFIADLIACSTFSGTIMPIIRSSRVLYSGCCLWYFVLWFSSCWSDVELRVMCPVCRMLQHPANHSTKYHRQQPPYNTLELLMMGVVMPENVEQAIRSAIKTSVASSWHFISTYRQYSYLLVKVKIKGNVCLTIGYDLP